MFDFQVSLILNILILTFNFQMLKEVIPISSVKPDVHKTLNIIISGYVNNIIIEL